jgi:hypothetical protein
MENRDRFSHFFRNPGETIRKGEEASRFLPMKIPLSNTLVAAVFAALVSSVSAQTTATWNFAGDGNWSDGAKWSTNPVAPINGQPLAGNTYNAILNTNRIVTVDVPVTIQGFTQSSGTLIVNEVVHIGAYALSGGTNTGGGSTLNLGGLFSWTGGSINGTGSLNADAGIDMPNITSRSITDRIIQTGGTTTWASSGFGFTLAGSASITNNGTWNVSGGQGMSGGVFNNHGAFNKTGGTETTIATRFNNTTSGTVALTNATSLNLNGTGTNAHAGTFEVGAGSTLIFNIGSNSPTDIHQINDGAAFTGSGTVDVRGRFVANADIEIGTGFLMKGNISGPGTITTTGIATWESATLLGVNPATDIFNAESTLDLNSVSARNLNARTLNTSATTQWGTSGFGFGLSNGAVINNLAAGIWNVTGSQSMSGGTFNNHGEFNKSAGAMTTLATTFNNTTTGSVTLDNATTLNLNGTGTNAHAGTFDVGADSTLILNIGSNSPTDIHQFNEGIEFVGAGTLDNRGRFVANTDLEIGLNFLMKGNISGPGVITTTGIASWQGATLLGANPATDILNTNNTLNINPGGQLNGRTLNTSGTTHWSTAGFDLAMFNGAVINNLAAGIWNVTGNQSMSGGTFNNQGEFNKSAGATTTLAIVFNNTGTVNVSSGTGLTVSGSVTQHAGAILSDGTWNVSNGSTLTFTTGSNITTNQADVTLDGAGSTFARFTTALNENQGGLTLKNDRDLTTAGALANSGDLRIEDSATLLTVNGAYTQTAGSTTLVGDSQVTTSGGFNLQGGTLSGQGTINGNLVSSGSPIVSPGTSAGVIGISGNASLSGSLVMEIGGLAPGTGHDQLLVGGNLTLGGSLSLSFIDGFIPLFGQNITLVDAGSPIAGSFINVPSGTRLMLAGNIHSFAVHYGPGSAFGTDKVVLTDFSDSTPPVLTLPADMTVEAEGPAGTVVEFEVIADDAVQGLISPPALAITPVSGSTFPVPAEGDPQLALGETTVNVSASDVGGNTSNGSFTVTVEDTTPPEITPPPNLVVEASGPLGAVATFSAGVTDIVDPDPAVGFSKASGSTFPLGVTTVTITASDFEDNESTASFTVTVVDTTPPAITVPDPIIAEATGPDGALVNFLVSAADLVDPAPVIEVSPPSGSLFAPGETTVTVTATDATGNESINGFNVTVVDTTSPTLTLPAVIAEATSLTATSIVHSATAVDIVDGDLTGSIVFDPSSLSFPFGESTVEASVTDLAGNSSSGSFTVTIQDTTPPVLSVPSEPVSASTTSLTGVAVDFSSLIPASDLPGAPAPIVIASPASGSVFALGTTTVTVTATDHVGLETIRTFDVMVTGLPRIMVEETGGDEIADGGTLTAFPATTPTTTSAPKSITVRNNGAAPLVLGTIATAGDHPDDFAAGPPGGPVLAPGESIGLSIEFTPSAVGPRTAVLQIASNDPDLAEYDIILEGEGADNSPPAFPGYTVTAIYETPLSVSLVKLLFLATDPDGDELSVTSVDPDSSEGGTAELLETAILYTPAAGFSGTDTFTVTISDEHGATVQGLVTVNVGPAPDLGDEGTNKPAISLAGGKPQLRFRALPNTSYQLQRSADGMATWQNLEVLTTDRTGLLIWTDVAPPAGSAFYRFLLP